MAKGKLYKLTDNQFISEVSYRFNNDSKLSWWGELMITGNTSSIRESDGCILELEDKRKGKCYIKKMVNRAVSAVPSRFVYRFTGTSALE